MLRHFPANIRPGRQAYWLGMKIMAEDSALAPSRDVDGHARPDEHGSGD